MVHPVLQDKIIRDIKKYCSHISGLSMRLVLTAGPDGICTFLPHQSFGLTMGPKHRQVYRNAGVTFYAITWILSTQFVANGSLSFSLQITLLITVFRHINEDCIHLYTGCLIGLLAGQQRPCNPYILIGDGHCRDVFTASLVKCTDPNAATSQTSSNWIIMI